MTRIVIEGTKGVAVKNVFLGVAGFGTWTWTLVGGFLVRGILFE
jgi:hypothetical protein